MNTETKAFTQGNTLANEQLAIIVAALGTYSVMGAVDAIAMLVTHGMSGMDAVELLAGFDTAVGYAERAKQARDAEVKAHAETRGLLFRVQ